MHPDRQRRHDQRLPGSCGNVAARRQLRPRVRRRDDDARQALHRCSPKFESLGAHTTGYCTMRHLNSSITNHPHS